MLMYTKHSAFIGYGHRVFMCRVLCDQLATWRIVECLSNRRLNCWGKVKWSAAIICIHRGSVYSLCMGSAEWTLAWCVGHFKAGTLVIVWVDSETSSAWMFSVCEGEQRPECSMNLLYRCWFIQSTVHWLWAQGPVAGYYVFSWLHVLVGGWIPPQNNVWSIWPWVV